MTQQTELEKTQLEIARLQLEQERRKLAGMQRRSEAVGSLGRGVKKVGEASKKTALWALFVALGAALGAAVGSLSSAAVFAVISSASCRAVPGADLLYRVGCAVGEKSGMVALVATIGVAYGAYGGHRVYRTPPKR